MMRQTYQEHVMKKIFDVDTGHFTTLWVTFNCKTGTTQKSVAEIKLGSGRSAVPVEVLKHEAGNGRMIVAKTPEKDGEPLEGRILKDNAYLWSNTYNVVLNRDVSKQVFEEALKKERVKCRLLDVFRKD